MLVYIDKVFNIQHKHYLHDYNSYRLNANDDTDTNNSPSRTNTYSITYKLCVT